MTEPTYEELKAENERLKKAIRVDHTVWCASLQEKYDLLKAELERLKDNTILGQWYRLKEQELVFIKAELEALKKENEKLSNSAMARRIEMQQQTILSLELQVGKLREALHKAIEYFDDRADIIFRDEDSKEIPNKEMQMVTELEEALSTTPSPKAWEALHDETKAKLLALEKENGELKKQIQAHLDHCNECRTKDSTY